MSRIFCSGLILIAALLAGCDVVTAAHPIGTPVVDAAGKGKDRGLRDVLNGTWLNPDEGGDPMFVRYRGDGEVVFKNVEWDNDKDAFVLKGGEGLITEDDGVLYLNICLADFDMEGSPPEDEAEKARYEEQLKGYMFFRLEIAEDGRLIIKAPIAGAFAAAIKDGTLKGWVEKGKHSTEAHIRSDAKAWAAFIDPKKEAQQFIVDETIILKRVKGE